MTSSPRNQNTPMTSVLNRLPRLSLAAVLLLSACEGLPPPGAPDPRNNPVFEEAPRALTTLVSGYSWDPEVYAIGFASCPPPCLDLAPFISDFLPPFSSTMVAGSNVTVVSAMTGAPVATAGTSGMFDGVFSVDGVPSDPEGLYLVTADGDGELISPPFGPPPPAPTTYLPTVTLTALATAGSPTCAMTESARIGSNGVLEAVAKHLAVTVPDLLDPTQYSVVAVLWAYGPGPFFMRTPANGMGFAGSVGDTYQINWAIPETMDPAVQSERGFFVDTSGPGSALGITVGVVPASVVLEGPVLYFGLDPVDDPMFGRPYDGPPAVVFPSPGSVTSASMMFFPGGPPPEAAEGEEAPSNPDFLCTPAFEGPPPGP